jgi:C1A family cysteine protease
VAPVVVGLNWYSSMFHPNAAGLIKVDGSLAGGHAFLLDGVSADREYFRIKNSWGRSWGRKGFALISFKDVERLLAEDGEACLAVETKKA